MYLTFYGLKRDAFHTTPDPGFLYMSTSHQEALGAIIYGIEKRKGFVAITGEVGVGKTTILRAYLENHSNSQQKTIYIFNPVLSYHELLTSIFRSLEIAPVNNTETEMVNQLHETLIEIYKTGGTVTLLIDEAQNMPISTLENLRMLSNLETATDKLIQIILVGQSELETLLQQPALRQFQQRIALRAKICPLTEKESQAFILHRIAVASVPGNPVFTKKALQLIAKKGQGIPRRLNILCDNALITGYGRQVTPVPVNVVKEILIDIDGPTSPVLWKWAVAAGVILLLGIGVMAFWGSLNLDNNSNVAKDLIREKSAGPTPEQLSSMTSIKDRQLLPIEVANEDLSKPLSPLTPHTTPDKQQLSSLNKESKSLSGLQLKKNLSIDLDQNRVDESRSSLRRQRSGASSSILSQELHDDHIDSFNRQSPGLKKSFMAQSVEDPANTQIEPSREAAEAIASSDSSSTLLGLDMPNKGKMTRSVKYGESLSLIARETYGSPNKEYVDWVKRHNPHIEDPDLIIPGQEIILPDYQTETVFP